MSFLLMPEGCLFPVGLILQIRISDLTCRHLRVTAGLLLSAAKRPREGGSIESRRANLMRLLCHSHILTRQILIIGTASMLIHSGCTINGPRCFCSLRSARFAKWWLHRTCACLWGARYIYENHAQHALMWLHKWLFFLLAFNDVGPKPKEQQGQDSHYERQITN